MQQDASSSSNSAALLNSAALEAYEPKPLDISSANRSVWIAKVPKYLAEMWTRLSHEQPGTPVGVIRNVRVKVSEGQSTSDITYKPSEELRQHCATEYSDPNKRQPPLTLSDHQFTLLPVRNQMLYVFLEQFANGSAQKPGSDSNAGSSDVGQASNSASAGTSSQVQSAPASDRRIAKRQLVGSVTRKWECRPQADAAYMMLKRAQYRAQGPAKRIAVVTERVDNFLPKNDHRHIIEEKQRKQEAAVSRPRVEGDRLKDIVCRLFEERQRITMADLMRRTGQPQASLKSVLTDIAVYNKEGEFRNTYELKPEFGHYTN